MVKPKRKSGVLHHRVPDFQLVYCGSNRKLLGQAVRQVDRRMKLKASSFDYGKDADDRRLKQNRRIGALSK